MKLLKDLDLKVGDRVKCVGNTLNAYDGEEYEVVPHEYLKGKLALDLSTGHELASYTDSLFEKVEDKRLITMDGEYALSDDPYTPIRILCVDRPSEETPVVIMLSNGTVSYRKTDGSAVGRTYPHIVPLKKKVGPVWCVFDKENCFITSRISEERAERFIHEWGQKEREPYRIVKMVQAED